jgi:2-haloacid dehalogenase
MKRFLICLPWGPLCPGRSPPIVGEIVVRYLAARRFRAGGGRVQRCFADIGAHILRGLLLEAGMGAGVDEAIEHVLAGMAELTVHPDVPDEVRGLKESGYGLMTLSNGAADVAETLLTRAGLRDEFGLLLSVEDAAAWKPARAAYDTAAAACGKSPEQMLLVAAHPWDIHGAAEAGLQTAWINRSGAAYPEYFTTPDYTLGSLGELPDRLAAAGS